MSSADADVVTVEVDMLEIAYKSTTFEAKSAAMSKEQPPSYRAIHRWAEEDRPREKMLLKGRDALSDAELIAILLGSGTRGRSAVAVAQDILASVGNSLHALGQLGVADLKRIKGIGKAKAIAIAAALELGRRRQLADLRERPRVQCSEDAYHAIAALLTDLHHEEFWLLMLNRRHEIIARKRVSNGGTHATVVDAKLVFQEALDAHASSIIAVHNHPSGRLEPSDSDIKLTQDLVAAGKVLHLPLLDHLIVSRRGYYSFADNDMLES